MVLKLFKTRWNVSQLLYVSLTHFWKKSYPFGIFKQQILVPDRCWSKSIHFQELLLHCILQIKTLNSKKIALRWKKQIIALLFSFVGQEVDTILVLNIFVRFLALASFCEGKVHQTFYALHGSVWTHVSHNPYHAFTRNFILFNFFKNCFHFCNIHIFESLSLKCFCKILQIHWIISCQKFQAHIGKNLYTLKIVAC